MLRSQSPEGSQSCQAQCSCSGAPPPSKLVQHLWYYEGSQIELKRANKIRVCCLQTWFTWKKADSSLTYLYISQAAFELKVIETCIHVVTVISSLDKPIAKGAAVGSHWGGHPHHPLRDSTLLFVDHGTYGLRLLEEFAGLKTSTDLESSDLQGKLAAPELDHIDPRRSINLWRVADVGESRGLSCSKVYNIWGKGVLGGLRRSWKFPHIHLNFLCSIHLNFLRSGDSGDLFLFQRCVQIA